ncbi:hypothetical protein GUJ93_ZPchr0001g32523 [Zizania palustris]|uniref:OPA3-like protein n=1 Tax=Zizania palustris TaxID=103762 RepID=A0A8J5RKK6_ZIZPA|nr:hypothetical protein GUJ93_ZPchr0001g32523 [Zizania palustris]
MVLPLVKLGSLAFRTLSKPIAARLKHNAGIHPKFRGFIVGLAQVNHRFTTNMHRRLYGRATDIHIRPLNEEKAIQAAADILGELFVFSVAGAAIIYEVQRSARAEARKEETRRQEIEARKKRVEELASEVQIMKQRISEIERCQCDRPQGFRVFTTASQAQAATAAAAAAAARPDTKHQQLTAAAA